MPANSQLTSEKSDTSILSETAKNLEFQYLQNQLKHFIPTLKILRGRNSDQVVFGTELNSDYVIYYSSLRSDQGAHIPLVSLPELTKSKYEVSRPKFNLEIVIEGIKIPQDKKNQSKDITNFVRLQRRLIQVDIVDVVMHTLNMIKHYKKSKKQNNFYPQSAA